ncbi:serine/threonine-protein kinase [Streptomyces bungoensis]|uniref:serine/threonine-protein kinase n=1 Tax=Streptomyces bungoensis TaxID=285568 RepID=UPI0034227BF4
MAPRMNAGAGAEAERPEYAGHYRLESVLGSGGMGVVHLARSTSGMKLAVKVVHAEFARDPEFRGRFRQEVAAARRVSGAFTAPVVDADPEAERPWMATLFIPGPTLSEEVKRNGPMAPAQVRRLMAGLAEALRDIHRVGVVHRDLKPSNVLLAEDGPKVIDFGISRPKDSELRTETGKLIGTPPFMAPEQFRRPREVGPAADVFALGSVMVHAATGRGPFDSDSPYVVAYQVVHDEPDLTGVPDDLAPLVLRCLAKEPEDRPTPDELMRELRTVAASYDTQTFIPAQRSDGDRAPEPRAEQPTPSVRRRFGRRAVVGVGALGAVSAAVLASVQLAGTDQTAPTGAHPRTTAATTSPWETKPAHERSGTPHCSYALGKLLCARPGVVFALSPADGKLLWRRSVPTRSTSAPPVVSASYVQPYTDGGPQLAALDPDSGREVWKRRLAQGTTVRYTERAVLLTRPDGKVTGVDSASGNTRWSRRIAGQGRPSFVSFPGDPLAYATSTSLDGTSTRIAAVDPQSGDVRWQARLDGTLEPLGSGHGTVFFASTDRIYGDTKAVIRYTPATRSTRRVVLPVASEAAQATVRGNTVYLLSASGSLTAVDLDARKQLWRVETSVSRASAPVADGRHVYFTAGDGRLLAVDARRGTLVGQTSPRLSPDPAQVMSAPPTPALGDDRVYATAPDGTVFGVNARDPAGW